MPLPDNQKRIESIDVVRGIAMVIMALDHVRDFFHVTANVDDPLNLATTTPFLYFTRWITNFCAPAFIFLSGTSIYLQGLRKSRHKLSVFLLQRGLWLILVEVLIISFAWSFNPQYNYLFLQVIWAIGICMVIMGGLIYLPLKVNLALGLLLVFGHNLMDAPEAAPGFHAGFWWDLFHHGRFVPYTFVAGHSVLLVYPFVPWLGLMILGYCAGVYFSGKYSVAERRKILVIIGGCCMAAFVILRFMNSYGDPRGWHPQKDGLHSMYDFMNVNKYPPSLLFMLITIGPMLLLLAIVENYRNTFTETMRIFGRVAFFYYVLHIYLIHLLATFVFFGRGHTFEEAFAPGQSFPFRFIVPGEGFGLAIVYLVWILVVIALYPLCRWYNAYKTAHPGKRWLSYL